MKFASQRYLHFLKLLGQESGLLFKYPDKMTLIGKTALHGNFSQALPMLPDQSYGMVNLQPSHVFPKRTPEILREIFGNGYMIHLKFTRKIMKAGIFVPAIIKQLMQMLNPLREMQRLFFTFQLSGQLGK